MQLLRNPFFLLAGIAYLVNRYCWPLLHLPQNKIPYLNDVLCLPITLSLALFIQQRIFSATARQRLNPAQVVFTFLYFSVFFEGILPTLATRYTRDWWDLVAYAAGGLLFYYGINPKAGPGNPSAPASPQP
jgi:hypothetical protein